MTCMCCVQLSTTAADRERPRLLCLALRYQQKTDADMDHRWSLSQFTMRNAVFVLRAWFQTTDAPL